MDGTEEASEKSALPPRNLPDFRLQRNLLSLRSLRLSESLVPRDSVFMVSQNNKIPLFFRFFFLF